MRPAHTCPRTMSACQVNRTYRKPKSVLNSTLHIVSAISKADWGTGETLKLESRWRILFTSKLHLEANIISKCICIDIDIDIGGADKINDLFLDWRNSLRISSWDDIVSRCKLRKISRTKRHGGGRKSSRSHWGLSRSASTTKLSQSSSATRLSRSSANCENSCAETEAKQGKAMTELRAH